MQKFTALALACSYSSTSALTIIEHPEYVDEYYPIAREIAEILVHECDNDLDGYCTEAERRNFIANSRALDSEQLNYLDELMSNIIYDEDEGGIDVIALAFMVEEELIEQQNIEYFSRIINALDDYGKSYYY